MSEYVSMALFVFGFDCCMLYAVLRDIRYENNMCRAMRDARRAMESDVLPSA